MANDFDVSEKELWAGIEYLKTEVSRLAQENAAISRKYKLLEQATAWARPVQAKIEQDLQKEASEQPEELEEYNIIDELTELLAWLGRIFYLAGNFPLFKNENYLQELPVKENRKEHILQSFLLQLDLKFPDKIFAACDKIEALRQKLPAEIAIFFEGGQNFAAYFKLALECLASVPEAGSNSVISGPRITLVDSSQQKFANFRQQTLEAQQGLVRQIRKRDRLFELLFATVYITFTDPASRSVKNHFKKRGSFARFVQQSRIS